MQQLRFCFIYSLQCDNYLIVFIWNFGIYNKVLKTQLKDTLTSLKIFWLGLSLNLTLNLGFPIIRLSRPDETAYTQLSWALSTPLSGLVITRTKPVTFCFRSFILCVFGPLPAWFHTLKLLSEHSPFLKKNWCAVVQGVLSTRKLLTTWKQGFSYINVLEYDLIEIVVKKNYNFT